MAKSDGSIIIDSKIDTSGFTQGEVNMKSSFGKIASAAGKMGAAIKSAFTVKSNGADGLEEKSEEIKISVDNTAKSVEDGMQRINEALSSGESANAFDTIGEKVENLKNELKYLQEIKGISFGNERFDALYQQLVLAENELKQYKATLAETAMAEQNATKTTGLMQSVLNALARAAHAPISALQLLGNAMRQIPHATLNLVSGGLHKIADAAKNAAKRIGSGLVSGLKKAGAAMLSFHKSTQKSNSSLGGGIKTLLKYGLGIRSLYALFNKARSAIKEGFQNLAQYSGETNAHLSALMSSLTQLKNSLATVFNPILSVVTPILTKFIDMVSKAATYVGMLFAALTGKNSFVKAVKVQEDYAASLGDTAENAKKALKYLSGLDEIRTFTEEQEGSGGYQPPKPEDMFETVEIPDKIKDLAQWLKDMWANADFTELGALLGQKLKDALDNIPWDAIKENASKIGKSLATFINGFVEVEGLGYSIGTTLAEAINTAFEFLNSFVHNLHWESIGKFIAETINGFFTNIDWPLIYDTFITGAKGIADAINSFNEWLDWDSIATSISNFFNTVIDTFYTFITETDWISLATNLGKTVSDAFTGIDWGKAGETAGEAFKALFNFIATTIENIDWWAVGIAVKDYLVGIDWAGAAQAMFEAIGAALGALAAFIGGLIGDAVINAQEYFQGKIEEAGGNIVEGILVGIAEALVGIGNWIVNNIFTPFIEGFCKVFGINSLSTVMAEMGGFIISGLLNGLVEQFTSVITWLASLPEKFKEAAIEIWTAIQKPFADIASWFEDKFSKAWEAVKKVFSSGGKIFDGIKDGILEGLKAVVNTLIRGINTVISIPFNGINSALKSIKGVDILGLKPFSWISTIDVPQIPYLATGAVIPPNAPFMAVLGDQKRGNNLEGPESMFRKIVREESGNSGVRIKEIRIPLYLSGKQVLEAIITEAQLQQMMNGRNPFEMA